MGQGGYLAGVVAADLAGPVAVDFRRPIPVDTPLEVESRRDRLRVSHRGAVVANISRAASPGAGPPPVPLGTAEEARRRAEADFIDDVRPCFSCGDKAEGLRVHAGPTGGGLHATPYRPPRWTAGADGLVEIPFVWAPVDCASGWCAGWEHPRPRIVTGWMSFEITRPLEPEVDYVIVTAAEGGWRGRMRRARAAVYTVEGEPCASSETLWVALPDGGGRG